MADGVAPEWPGGLLGAGIRLALLAGVFGLAGLRGRGRWGGWRTMAWGGVLLAGLPVAFAGGVGRVSGPTELLVFALIPAVVVFLEVQRAAGFGVERGTFALLGPALAGLAGAGLLLSYALPVSAAGKGWLAAMVVLAAVAGVAVMRLHESLRDVSPVRGAGMLCAGGAGACLLFCWMGWEPAGGLDEVALGVTAVRMVALDVPAMLLTAWLLRELEPVRFSSRYLFGLLVAVGESFVLARPGLSWTIGLGALLLASGGVTLARNRWDAA